jgi:SAM-dependent methyltransferase
MHPVIYREFERICAAQKIRGRVLEVGAVPNERSLLCMASLAGASEKVGINLDGPHTYRDFRILKGNANQMDCFADQSFDAVLCNATLEHDRFFWKTVAEIRRVTRPGGLIVIGVPGYVRGCLDRVQGRLRRLPLLRRLAGHRFFNGLFAATLTYQVHNSPGDYYRFSPQAVAEIFFQGCTDVSVRSVMLPPRLIGCGIRL